MVAVIWPEFTNVVSLAEPLNLTTELEMKFVPLTVKVKPESPTVLDAGSIEVVVGAGLLTVNVWAFEVPPPGVGLKTVMSKVPAVVRSEVRMVAVICVELT